LVPFGEKHYIPGADLFNRVLRETGKMFLLVLRYLSIEADRYWSKVLKGEPPCVEIDEQTLK
jgi:hypothetical protein